MVGGDLQTPCRVAPQRLPQQACGNLGASVRQSPAARRLGAKVTAITAGVDTKARVSMRARGSAFAKICCGGMLLDDGKRMGLAGTIAPSEGRFLSAGPIEFDH